MADLLDFSITPGGNVNVNIPRAIIAGRVVDSSNQSILIADYTGPNALIFPSVLATLTAAQRQEFIDMNARWIILTKAGQPT